MKQYTTPEQTAKLIEMGFAKPKSIWALSRNCPSDIQLSYESSLELTIRVEERFIPEYAYSIGELIEMLPPKIDGRNLVIERYEELGQWLVCYESCLGVYSMSAELSDALYDMVIKLKEEGVI